jgi:arylformamidase
VNKIVYRTFDQATLDLEYNNQANVADPARHVAWYGPASARARARVAHDAGIAYGGLPDEQLDIFKPPNTGSGDSRPVVIFVHGGAWRSLDLAGSAFAAETFTARGALYVPLGFSVMPAAGTLDEMVAQVRAGIAWVWQNISAHGGDPSRLHLIGHSSGGHLAAMALVTDWQRLYGLPASVLKSCMLVSGLYDLEPVRLSYRNDMLKLDRTAELRNSPCRNLPSEGPPTLIAYGEHETSEFKRQATAFEASWNNRYGNSRHLELAGVNHYEAIEMLVDPASQISRAAMEWFGL